MHDLHVKIFFITTFKSSLPTKKILYKLTREKNIKPISIYFFLQYKFEQECKLKCNKSYKTDLWTKHDMMYHSKKVNTILQLYLQRKLNIRT